VRTIRDLPVEIAWELALHEAWTTGRGGRRVDLSWVDLSGVDLRGVDLSGADLSGADL